MTLDGPLDPRVLDVPCSECHAPVGEECLGTFARVLDRFHGERLVLWYEYQRPFDREMVEARLEADELLQQLRQDYIDAVTRMHRADPELDDILKNLGVIGELILRRIHELGYRGEEPRGIPSYRIVPGKHD